MTTRVEAKQILKERARKLARAPVECAEGPAVEAVEFRLGGERYALETASLREVHPLKDLAPVPCTPAFVKGLINVRGRILTVIDLRAFFGLPEDGLHDLHQVLIVEAGDVELGILADSVVGTLSVPLSQLQPPLPTLTGVRAEYLKGVTGDRLALLDAARILSAPKMLVNEDVTA